MLHYINYPTVETARIEEIRKLEALNAGEKYEPIPQEERTATIM